MSDILLETEMKRRAEEKELRDENTRMREALLRLSSGLGNPCVEGETIELALVEFALRRLADGVEYSTRLVKALNIAERGLEKLQRLGNGDRPGNSTGNVIATETLSRMREEA
jgi:hypothetical protein